MTKSPPPAVLLVDNGSLEPAATRALRALAHRLGEATGMVIRPVSLLHSSAIAPELLEGRPAEILEPTLRMFAGERKWDVLVLPLFIGPSGALTRYLPERIRHLRETWPQLSVRVAPCLVDVAQKNDQRVAAMLAGRVRETARQNQFSHPAVAVVDHGTPECAVNDVREHITAQVRGLLGDFARTVVACSMERRAGPEYDFNEPLLKDLLNRRDFSTDEIIIARLFLQPGRHAGPGGDIEQIAQAAATRAGLKIACTEPLGSHPELVPILMERLAQGLPTPPG